MKGVESVAACKRFVVGYRKRPQSRPERAFVMGQVTKYGVIVVDNQNTVLA